MCKRDVICENLPYGGANHALIDQHFPYVKIHRSFLNCAESEEMFSSDTDVC